MLKNVLTLRLFSFKELLTLSGTFAIGTSIASEIDHLFFQNTALYQFSNDWRFNGTLFIIIAVILIYFDRAKIIRNLLIARDSSENDDSRD